MNRILFLLSLLMVSVSMSAAYIVHGVSGDINVIRNGKAVPLQKGMSVSPSDIIEIPEKAQVEILNQLDNKVYTSVKCGSMSVIRLMLDAKQQASDNGAAVKGQMAVAKGGGDSDGRLYIQKGMVKRSQAVFGDLSENVDVDPKTLARYVASVIYAGDLGSGVELPVKVTHSSGDNGLEFTVSNDVDFPVYLNVLKIGGGDVPVIEVSEIGQPSGCYVVYPQQSLMRGQSRPTVNGNRHVLVMSHCKFDIAEVIDMIGNLLQSDGIGSLDEKNAPVSMLVI